MNTVRNNHRAATAARPVRGILLRALPWALAAGFGLHLVMAHGLHLYKAGPAATHVLEACLAAAVLIWVWRALRRMEDLPAGNVAADVTGGDEFLAESGRIVEADHDPAPAIDCHGNAIGDWDYTWSS